MDRARPMQRPRIAYVMSRFPKLSETFVLREVLALERAGVTVDVYPLLRHREPVTHPEAQPLVDRANYHPFLSWRIAGAQVRLLRADPGRYLKTLWAVMRGTWGSANFFFGALAIFPKTALFAAEMKGAGVTHVHAHFANHPAAAAFIIHRLSGIPYSFTAHGSDLHVDRTMLPAKTAAARFVVAISEFNRALIIDTCGPWAAEKIRVIHCGVDAESFTPVPNERTDSHLHVACVASLEPIKGHTHLIEALRIVADRGIEFTCELLGDGPERDAVARQITEADLAGRVRLLGARPTSDVVALLRRANVFALTSFPTARGQREGIPVALMEAMAAELPVVTSATGGIPELVEHDRAGFVVEPGNVGAIADALTRLARESGTRRDMGREGRRAVECEFDLETNARTLAELFSGPLLHRTPSPSVTVDQC